MSRENEVIKYLNNLSYEERSVLGAIREQIFEIEPNINEKLSRGVPFFYYKGKRAFGFRSSKTHLSFFIMEGNVLKNLRSELEEYDVSSTVIRFSVEKPLPKNVIKKLVLTRIAEIEKLFIDKNN